MSSKDKLLYRIYSTVETITEENKKPDMMLVILIVNIVVPVLLSTLVQADALQPLLDKTKTEWEGSGVILAALIGIVVGTLSLLFGRGWISLLYGLIGAFLGGGAYGISSCTTSQGKGVNWAP